MFSNILCVVALILLAGCTNKILPEEELLAKARQKYDSGAYKTAAQLLREIDSEYAWSSNTLDALLLLAKSTLEGGKRDWWTAKKDLLESIQICDLLLIYDPEFSLKNDVNMVKIHAYYAMIDFDARRCDQMARKLIDAVIEYEKSAKENNMMEYYERNRKELKEMTGRCRWYVTARALEQSSLTSNHEASLEIIDLAEKDEVYGHKYPELYYRKLVKLLNLKVKESQLFEMLQNIYMSKGDLKWLRLGIELFEQKVDQSKLTQIQRNKVRFFKSYLEKCSR